MTPPFDSTASAILTAIDAVNANVVATREEMGEFRREITATVATHAQRIQALEVEKASENGVWKGLKMPLAAGGALILVILDHMEHGKALLSWIYGNKP